MINKLPQIMKIWKNKSVEGIEPSMIYTDLLLNINKTIYFHHTNLAFSLYGEFVILCIQNIILLFQIWFYSKSISAESKIKYSSLTLIYVSIFVFIQGIPEFIWRLLISTASIINLISKIPQIITNYRSKSTGQLSFQTYFINFIRTFLKDVDNSERKFRYACDFKHHSINESAFHNPIPNSLLC